MEKHIGLVVLEHLGNELNVHVLDVDFLQVQNLGNLGLRETINETCLPAGSCSTALWLH